MYKVLTLSCLLTGVLAQHHGEDHGGHHEEHKVVDYYAPPHYKYEYSVHDSHTHDIKKQEEERKDDHVKGFYSLHEADGTVREVHYTSDKHNGFNAVVHRSGHAKHPQKYGSSGEKYYGHHLEEHHQEEGGHHGEESGGAESSSSFFGHY